MYVQYIDLGDILLFLNLHMSEEPADLTSNILWEYFDNDSYFQVKNMIYKYIMLKKGQYTSVYFLGGKGEKIYWHGMTYGSASLSFQRVRDHKNQ